MRPSLIRPVLALFLLGWGLFLTVSACAPKPPPPTTIGLWTPGHEPWRRYAPMCKLDHCCAGHGEVAYLQPDKFIMCTDGQTSQTCDCH